jgi:hypothetical protein
MRFPFFNKKRDTSLQIRLPEVVNVGFGVLFSPPSNNIPERGDLIAMAQQWLRGHAQGPLRDALTEYVASPLVMMEVKSAAQIPLPELRLLRAMKLGQEEEQRLTSATHGVMLFASDTLRPPRFGLHAANALAYGIAETTNGVVFDPECVRVVPIRQYSKSIPETGRPVMVDHICCPTSAGERRLGLITTTGLAKFGLPNLKISHVPADLLTTMSWVVCAIADHLVMATMRLAQERQSAPAELVVDSEFTIRHEEIAAAAGEPKSSAPEGVQGWTTVRLQRAKGGQLGRNEEFLEILPPSSVRIEQSVWCYSVVEDLLGREDRVMEIKSGSESMEIAHRRAVDELPEIKERVLRGLQPGEILSIKHGFPMPGGNKEYMWIVVNAWKGQTISGTLANEPQSVPNLRAGQTVQVGESEIYDWFLKGADGSLRGNYTSRVLEREAMG